MRSTLEVIKKYFPEEKIQQEIQVAPLSTSTKLYPFPLSKGVFFAPQGTSKIVETTHFWFIDLRESKKSLPSQILGLFYITVFISVSFFATNFDLAITLPILSLFIGSTFIYQFYNSDGYSIEIYKKQWAKKTQEHGLIKIHFSIPKYSHTTIFSIVTDSKWVNWSGMTINTLPLEREYTFTVTSEK